jgi:AcrR family transcriptional regulator
LGRPLLISNEDLLAVAREVFVRDGASGSTREIATRAGISEAALFQRFSTKPALFLAAMAPTPVDAAAIAAAARAQPGAREGLMTIAELTLDYFREALPVILPVVTHPSIGLEALLGHLGRNPAMRLSQVAEDFLAEQHAAGAMTVADPRAAAAMLVAAMHSIALFEIMGLHGGDMPTAGVRGLVDSLWNGLAPKAG